MSNLNRILRYKVLLVSVLFFSHQIAFASWSNDPAINNPISTAPKSQSSLTIISDGSGGAIIAWLDYRGGMWTGIYAQRVDSNGNPLWTLDGQAISVTSSEKNYLSMVQDGTGGAIIVWTEYGAGLWDILAQRIDSNGAIKWNPNGVVVSGTQDNESYPAISSDGQDGAIILWMDDRNFSSSLHDIFAQRVNADGTLLWKTAGLPICTAPGYQTNLGIVADGNGGAVFHWEDQRDSSGISIYAQKVFPNGNIAWPLDGVKVSNAPTDLTT